MMEVEQVLKIVFICKQALLQYSVGVFFLGPDKGRECTFILPKTFKGTEYIFSSSSLCYVSVLTAKLRFVEEILLLNTAQIGRAHV